MQNKIRPNGLKGNEVLSRMKELMNITPINENATNRSVLELVKKGPDGKTYGIVRENHEYFIKTSDKKGNLVAEDFQYIGGLQNKKEKAYESYAKAIKQLNLAFIGLSENAGTPNTINAFINDKFINENEEEAIEETEIEDEEPIEEGEAQCGIVRGKGHDKHIMEIEEDMNDNEKAIDEMIEGEITESIFQNKRLKIGEAIEKMDDAIAFATNERVDSILENMTDREKAFLLESLKKKA